MIVNRQDSSDRCWLPGTELGAGAPAAPPFAVLVDQPDPEVVVVSVVGEIDLLTTSVLRKHLSRQLAAGPRCLVIDLSHTSFLGVTALSALIDATQTAAHRGIRLQLTAPKRPLPARALNIAGLNRLYDIVASGAPTSDVIEALRAAEAYRGSALDQPLNGDHSCVTPLTFLGESDPQLCLIDDGEKLRLLLAQLTPRQRTMLTPAVFPRTHPMDQERS